MKSILTLCVFLLMINTKGFAQENMNAYKYVVVPTSFNFLNEPDQYQINSLTKFLFEKYGFTALMADEEFPEDLTNNRCLGLFADVEKHKAFLNTKLQVHMRDCNNKLVYSSEIGQSREKEFDKVYNLALRDAFKSFETLDYSYQANENVVKNTNTKTDVTVFNTKAKEEIERLQKEVEALKEKRVREEIVLREAAQKETVMQAEIKEEVKEVIKKEEKSDETIQTLFANPVENGYTITDASSKILYRLVFSGKEDVYIVKGQDAIVYKMNNTWIVANANDSGLSMKTLNVKF